jgi:hypothetical protein
MSLYGILRDPLVNTGQDSELLCIFAAPLTIKSNEPSFSGDSMNLRRNVRRQYVQRWEVTANIKPQSGSGELPAFLMRAGDFEVIGIRMPQVSMMAYTATGAKLNGGISPGDSSVALKNALDGGPFPVLLESEFIKIQGDSKVYMVTKHLGSGVYQVYPSIRSTLPIGTPVQHGGSVTMYVRIDKDNASNIKFTDGVLMDPGSFTFIEQL